MGGPSAINQQASCRQCRRCRVLCTADRTLHRRVRDDKVESRPHKQDTSWRTFLPKRAQKAILLYVHSISLAGHPWVAQTVHNMIIPFIGLGPPEMLGSLKGSALCAICTKVAEKTGQASNNHGFPGNLLRHFPRT
ncbi:hypothetical protein PR048_011725 [Dryococelus australis]|uniref:Uncharacterized protein n=1 Tax=Dryococelus australis TaxID=614101 RepID=A0ABQ9HMH1_9NEOP|nr:hypothetical protein PR048_011725 [Dryococelus australis]